MDILKDLLGNKAKYNIMDINNIMRKIQENLKEGEDLKAFRKSEKWNNLIQLNFNCSWNELIKILSENFGVFFNEEINLFVKEVNIDKLGFRDNINLKKIKVTVKELDIMDTFKFNEEKISYNKNVSFRVSEEAYKNIKTMTSNTEQNNCEFFSNMILLGYDKYFLGKTELEEYTVEKINNNYIYEGEE